jgi:hypothetical protein
MQVVRPHYFDPEGRHVIVDALGASIRSCFEETVAAPNPDALTAILRKLDRRCTKPRDVSDAIFTQFD